MVFDLGELLNSSLKIGKVMSQWSCRLPSHRYLKPFFNCKILLFEVVNLQLLNPTIRLCLQYSKIIQNPSYAELQKAANQGRRCTWEKLSAIKANCAIELALDESVALLNHMRRLKRSAERAAASHGLVNTSRFNASRRIPSWNCIARENSSGSLEEDGLADAAASTQQGPIIVGGTSSRNRVSQRIFPNGSDSESESIDLNSWTRCGGPLMRTSSANKFIAFLHSLDTENDNTSVAMQMTGYSDSRVSTSEQSSDNTDSDQNAPASTSIVVSEGDLLQPERIRNGIMFNVVKKETVIRTPRSSDSEQQQSSSMEVDVENLQLDSYDASSSECDEDENTESLNKV